MSVVVECVKAAFVGVAFGAIVRWCKLPIPAPPTVAGVIAVAGVAAGYYLAGRWIHG